MKKVFYCKECLSAVIGGDGGDCSKCNAKLIEIGWIDSPEAIREYED